MRRFFVQTSFWGFCFLAISQNSFATLYTLFDAHGVQPDNYNSIVEDLEHQRGHFPPDTQFRFGDGRVFDVVEFLGRGSLTAVFQTKNLHALRVPRRRGVFVVDNNGKLEPQNPYTFYIQEFFEGYKELEKVPGHVQMYPETSFAPEYIDVEYFPTLFTLEDFYLDRNHLISEKKLDPAQVDKLEEEFVRVAIGFAEFSDIFDFRDVQIGCDGHTWKLLDIGAQVRRAQKVNDPTLFDQFKFDYRGALPQSVRERILNEIHAARTYKLHLKN